MAPRPRPREPGGMARGPVRVRADPPDATHPERGGRPRVLGLARRAAVDAPSRGHRAAGRGTRGPRVRPRRDPPVGLLLPGPLRSLRHRRMAWGARTDPTQGPATFREASSQVITMAGAGTQGAPRTRRSGTPAVRFGSPFRLMSLRW